MTTRKHNEFLDIVSDDEDNDAGYDSEAAEESKGRTGKRRKTQARGNESDTGSADEESDASEGEESNEEEAGGVRLPKKQDQKAAQESDDQEDDQEDEQNEGEGEGEGEGRYLDVSGDTEQAKTKKTPKPLDNIKLKPNKKNKTGVIYFSSLPPYLKPFALKSLLEIRGFEPITKVFLSPAVRPPGAPRRRSNKRKTYSDGWVEFASKKTAKICAETLNATIVGGRKGGWYHDDVWNMKYLKGFKWADLMEQVQREKSERDAKRRIEDARARKEEKVFLQGHEKGKMLDGIQKKNEEKRRRKMAAGNRDGDEDGRKEEPVNARRLFKQNEVKVGRDKMPKNQGDVEEDTRRVLGKIF